MFPVVLGILLAFMINNWNESYKDKKELKIAKEQIVQEVINNLKECQRVIRIQERRNTFFSKYRDSIDTYSKRKLSLSQMPFEGVNVPTISRTAWDAANYSGIISQLDFEELQVLTSIYQMQHVTSEIQGQIISTVYGTNIYTPEMLTPSFYSLKMLNENYVDFLKTIICSYEGYLKKYAPNEFDRMNEESK